MARVRGRPRRRSSAPCARRPMTAAPKASVLLPVGEGRRARGPRAGGRRRRCRSRRRRPSASSSRSAPQPDRPPVTALGRGDHLEAVLDVAPEHLGIERPEGRLGGEVDVGVLDRGERLPPPTGARRQGVVLEGGRHRPARARHRLEAGRATGRCRGGPVRPAAATAPPHEWPKPAGRSSPRWSTTVRTSVAKPDQAKSPSAGPPRAAVAAQVERPAVEPVRQGPGQGQRGPRRRSRWRARAGGRGPSPPKS